MLDRPRIYVDFNETLETDLVILSQGDSKTDSEGNTVSLHAGDTVYIYMDNAEDKSEPGWLVAEGTVESNHVSEGWGSAAKWCCRINESGIKHLSEALQ